MENSKRDRAVKFGLEFIYQTACNPEHFSVYGSDFLSCFYWISATSSDPELRALARSLGIERAREWRREHTAAPPSAGPDDITDLVFGNDAAQRLGVYNSDLKPQLRKLAASYSANDYFFFDPTVEPPSGDVPLECSCGAANSRGAKLCGQCRRRLVMMSAYWVWLNAITIAYAGERHGTRLGASLSSVLKWRPVMSPYPKARPLIPGGDSYWAIYAVTHLIYALNSYSLHRLSPDWLPAEVRFLKESINCVIAAGDPETLGEILDALKSFGYSEKDPLIEKGLRYLLSSQNADGSWGDPEAKDIYERYHSTWTAIDGLREYAWPGKRLSFQNLRSLLPTKAPVSVAAKPVRNHAGRD